MDQEFWKGLQRIQDARRKNTTHSDCATPASEITPFEATKHASSAAAVLDGIGLICHGIGQGTIPSDEAIAFFEKLLAEVDAYLDGR